ncbi:HpcH/HpaI aldolase family protein [Faecalicoccus pleomorphus]|uniref:HpcH/HpaI aldolase family protein n=1 Tax=Faecalicoccus pleomorphus TaxID=1323 RepID=UPI00242E5D85|nr:aldolase/citrate lyase family protein [Faecalicoccus pleomorphus]
MKNIFREKLKANEPIIATRINSTWPVVAEVVGATGKYDYIEFLGEYAPYNQYDLENIARACELHGMSSIMKVDYANRDYVAQKALAAGIQGILFTDHTQAKEVEETLKMVKPATPQAKGRLGYVNRRWYKNEGFANQMTYADEISQCVIGFMVEKAEAVKNIEEICQVPGVDFIQFGPADFSMNSGFNHKENLEKVREVEAKVIQTALKYGVSPRVELNSAKEAERYIQMGVKHFALGSELRIEKVYWNTEGDELHSILDKG